MRYLLLTKVCFLLLFSFNAMAQYTLDTSATAAVRVENNDANQYITYSSGFSNTINTALHVANVTSTNDTVYFPVKVEGIIPSDAEDTDFDTLKINIAIRAYGVSSIPTTATTNAYFTYFNKYDSYEYSNFSKTNGGVSLYQPFKFVENQTDTLKIVLTAGQLSFDRFEIGYGSQEVVTNSAQPLFGDQGANVNNPVSDGMLAIGLPSDVTSAELLLFSLEGELVMSQTVTTSENRIDVSSLSKGMYLLTDKKTGSTKKIVIQ